MIAQSFINKKSNKYFINKNKFMVKIKDFLQKNKGKTVEELLLEI